MKFEKCVHGKYKTLRQEDVKPQSVLKRYGARSLVRIRTLKMLRKPADRETILTAQPEVEGSNPSGPATQFWQAETFDDDYECHF